MTIKTETIRRIDLTHADPFEPFEFNGHEYFVKDWQAYDNDEGQRRVVMYVGTKCKVCGAALTVQTCRKPKWLPKTCRAHRGQR